MTKQRPIVLILAIIIQLALTVPAFAQTVHWSYTGDTGPEHWGELSPDYALCSSGEEQSPVDIASTSPVNPPDLQFYYQPSALNIVNNGHTVQVNYDSGSTVEIDGTPYTITQFHFHNPSEHTVDG